MPHTVIDKLAWVAIDQRKLLVTRSHGKTLYYLPGGKREPGESDVAALVREIDEELSVTLDAQSAQRLTQLSAQADGKPAGTLVQLTCYLADYSGQLQPANEIAELAWIDSQDRARCSLAAQLLLDWLQQQQLVD
ncbi:MAG: NUDIX hydrolase [Aeromonadaceae bacterium]